MAFGKTSLGQTSWNVAATVVSALISVNEVPEGMSVMDLLSSVKGQVFEDLCSIEDSDGGTASTPSGGSSTPADPGSLRLKETYRKHAGKSLAEVYAVDPSYVEWLANKARDQFINRTATAFLAGMNGAQSSSTVPEYLSG